MPVIVVPVVMVNLQKKKSRRRFFSSSSSSSLLLFVMTRLYCLLICSSFIPFLTTTTRNYYIATAWSVNNVVAMRSSFPIINMRKSGSSSSSHLNYNRGGRRGILLGSSSSLQQFIGPLFVKNNNNNPDTTGYDEYYNNYLETLLRTHGYDRRLITISTSDLPLLVELQDQGQTHVCLLLRIESYASSSSSSDDDDDPQKSRKQPRLHIEMIDGTKRVVDVGQLTTIWEEEPPTTTTTTTSRENGNNEGCWKSLFLEDDYQQSFPFPVGHVDTALDRLYRGRVGQARGSSSSSTSSSSGTGGLTKKQVTKLVASAPENPDHVERVLRQSIKTGANFARLVDSSTAMEYLFVKDDNDDDDDGKSAQFKKKKPSDTNHLKQRAVAASTLAEDSKLGGRFKRMPCMLVSTCCYNNNDNNNNNNNIQDDDDELVVELSLLNGGWIVLDQSVRSGTEGRKFAERHSATPQTVADERIAQRLECLAMGQDMTSDDDDLSHLELDVREVLKAMDLPATPQGSKEALLRIGRWSSSSSSSENPQTKINPWPPNIIQAAEWYAQMDRKRRQELFKAVRRQQQQQQQGDAQKNLLLLEGRSDLTRLPCTCIDAARTWFRDDAIGVRPRSSTGRKVIQEASKWEILIHIADVSDVYASSTDIIKAIGDPSDYLGVLRDASLSRGASRYDLPLGPLHLMPPTVLQSLSLKTVNPDLTDKKNSISMNHLTTTNRCVTLWAYIDERSGKLIDAGLERSIISTPLALSFQSATALLDDSLDASDPALAKSKAVLRVAERNLKLWNQYHNQRNSAAQARERRMEVKEMVSEQMNQHGHHGGSGSSRGTSRRRDDGRDGFQRSRGHRLVDSSLELYGYAVGGLLKQAKAPVPRVSGDGTMRVATAPLRRYVDGMAQRQALSVLCGYGPRMTKDECIQAGKAATDAVNVISNIQSTKKGGRNDNNNKGGTARRSPKQQHQQRQALRALQVHLANSKGPVPAMGTGKQNQVAILGIGAIANCKGIKGSLKPGQKVMVQVLNMDEQRGTISTVLVNTNVSDPH